MLPSALPLSITPEQFDADCLEEVASYTKLIKNAGLTVD